MGKKEKKNPRNFFNCFIIRFICKKKKNFSSFIFSSAISFFIDNQKDKKKEKEMRKIRER